MSEGNPTRTETDAVAEIVTKNKESKLFDAALAPQILVFSDKTVLPLERFAANPRRKRASVSVDDQASFADYVNTHKVTGVTALFGRVNEAGGSFAGTIDYHAAADGSPFWGEHKVTLALAFTPEWKRWTAKDGVPMTQGDFAEHIEDNLSDIVSPPAADLLEVVQDLIAKKSVDFKSSVRLSNGQTSLLYDESIQTTRREGQIDVPNEFTVSVAPFVGSPMVGITARLRFRINDRRLQFIYKLNQPHKVIAAAFDSARTYIAEKTALPVLLGCAAVNPAPTS